MVAPQYRLTLPQQESFTFTLASDLPSVHLSFDLPTQDTDPIDRPLKRRRPLSDVDGESHEGRKKRRLRLQLITSRLSRPYSQPASNIINRGVSKIAVWGAKHRAHLSGRHLLRKAAIMNRVRMRMDAVKDHMRQEQERSRDRITIRELLCPAPATRNQRPRSPLGLSNYAALDMDDDIGVLDDDDEFLPKHDMSCKIDEVYSDFNVMNPVAAGESEDYDDNYLDAWDGIGPSDVPDTPPSPREESIVEMLREENEIHQQHPTDDSSDHQESPYQNETHREELQTQNDDDDTVDETARLYEPEQERRPPTPPQEEIVAFLRKEKEHQAESFFMHLRSELMV